MTPSEQVAEFVASQRNCSLPSEAVARVKSAIVDYTGVLLAGLEEPSAALVRAEVAFLGGNAQATLWGTRRKTSVTLAALVNGTTAHALDFDDANAVMLAHPSVQLLPALCALAECEERSGRDVIAAYVVGFEVGAVLGRAANPDHVAQGWFPVGTLGPVMEAAACASLLDLAPSETRMALSLAANFASGLRCNNGSMAKPLLAGHATSSGMLAALLAQRGLTANPAALESRFGYFENFTRRDADELARAMETLGDPLEILDSGIAVKPYPCCALAHGAVDCALEIVRRHAPSAADIEAVDIGIHAGAQVILIHPRPRTVAEARFSLEYCVSRALLDGALGVEQFRESKLGDPRVRDLMARARPSYDDRPLREAGERAFPVELQVRMRDGTALDARVAHARGTARNPMRTTDVEEKFRGCCAGRLSPATTRDVLGELWALDRADGLGRLVALLSDALSS